MGEEDDPTEEEEVSAATFLANVKTRLTDWGKEEQYHHFVAALSCDVDVKTVARILRGHDDLLWVFRKKFAPKADLVAIKGAVADEEEGGAVRGGPRPPTLPPTSRGPGGVKQELLASTPVTPRGGGAGGTIRPSSDGAPRPPSFPPGPKGVKREFGGVAKTEVKTEFVAPRPPKFAPGFKRPAVTIGDESDEEDDEAQDEASVLAAIKKGRQECVAELGKLVFRRERAAHDAARHRLAMVRYATQRAALPRFPREVYILRGAPGIGKTEYAMQHLLDHADYSPEDELAVRLTHVCSADDFFETFTSDEASSYSFKPGKVEPHHRRNEMRVRLAMEAGIHPLYVDCSNMHLWELRPYVELAERLGYVPTVVEPQEISDKSDDLEFLVEANTTADRSLKGKVVSRGLLAAFLKAFEPLNGEPSAEVDDFDDADPLACVREAERGEASRILEPVPTAPPVPRGMVRSKGKGHGKGGKQRPPPGVWW